MELKDYILKGIEKGEVLDLRCESSELDEILEESLGWMRDGIGNIDEIINNLKDTLYKQVYIFYTDLGFTLHKRQARMISFYLKNIVNKFKQDIASIKNDAIKD